MMRPILATILMVLSMTSCDYLSDLKRTGELVEKEIILPAPTEIDIWAPVKVVLTNSSDSLLRLSGPDFLIDGYELIHEKGKLTIRHQQQHQLQDQRLGTLTVPAGQLQRLTANAPSQWQTGADTLRFTHLSLVVNGKGIYTTSDLLLRGESLHLSVYGGINKSQHQLRGKIDRVHYHLQGGSDILAGELQTRNTEVIHKSFGDCHILVQEALKAQIFSTGNIYLLGQPNVEVSHHPSSIMSATGKIYTVD